MSLPKKMETPRENGRSKGILKEVSDSYGKTDKSLTTSKHNQDQSLGRMSQEDKEKMRKYHAKQR